MSEIEIAPLVPADAPAAQRLIQESFEDQFHPYMIATQHGAQAFLEAYLHARVLHPERCYLGAKSASGELVAYAEFRQLDSVTGFLSYICVSSQARGQRLAQRLIEDYLAFAPHLRDLQLDVFAHNAPARALYRRLGFEEISQTTWWRRALPGADPGNLSPLNLSFQNWPHALAAFNLYGFCELQVRFHGHEIRLGRMGAGVLKCPSPTEFADDALLAALRVRVPTLNEALLIAPATLPLPHPEAQMINQSLRLRWQLL